MRIINMKSDVELYCQLLLVADNASCSYNLVHKKGKVSGLLTLDVAYRHTIRIIRTSAS